MEMDSGLSWSRSPEKSLPGLVLFHSLLIALAYAARLGFGMGAV
jgi:hypothetical protein